MDSSKFNEIINFAIEREKEAVQFYQELQQMVSFNSHKELLKEFVLMEKSHITILENIRHTEAEKMRIPQIDNLMISDYLIESKPTSKMNYQDILIIAMKREEASYKFYSDLAKTIENDTIQKVFLKLASEEAKHKLHFEKIYDDKVLADN